MVYKYIMFRRGEMRFPVIFPEPLIHDEVARAIISMIPRAGHHPMMVENTGVVAGSATLDQFLAVYDWYWNEKF